MSDLVTTTGKERIEGAVFVNGLVAEDIKMNAGSTVAGVDLSDAVLLDSPADLGKTRLANRLLVAGLVPRHSSSLL